MFSFHAAHMEILVLFDMWLSLDCWWKKYELPYWSGVWTGLYDTFLLTLWKLIKEFLAHLFFTSYLDVDAYDQIELTDYWRSDDIANINNYVKCVAHIGAQSAFLNCWKFDHNHNYRWRLNLNVDWSGDRPCCADQCLSFDRWHMSKPVNVFRYFMMP